MPGTDRGTGLLMLALDPFGTARAIVGGTIRIGRASLAAALALPRIAEALERLTTAADAVDQLGRLSGTLDRLEQLGTFVAGEIPEAQHELAALRRELAATSRRIADLGPTLADATAVGRALADNVRSLTSALSAVDGLDTATVRSLLDRRRKA